MTQTREQRLRKVREAGRRRRADPAYREGERERARRRWSTPEAKERDRQRRSTPEYKEQRRQRDATPEARERARQSKLRGVARNRALVKEWGGKCAICGKSDPRCLDSHHIGPKSFDISRGISLGYSVERMQAELAKCACLCANCHRITHEQLERIKERMEEGSW